jgi:hypothetical protein
LLVTWICVRLPAIQGCRAICSDPRIDFFENDGPRRIRATLPIGRLKCSLHCMRRVSILAAYQLYLFKLISTNRALPPVFRSMCISYRDSQLNFRIIKNECGTYVHRLLNLIQLPYHQLRMVVDKMDVFLNPILDGFASGFTGRTSSANSMWRIVST